VPLEAARARARDEIGRLPERIRGLAPASPGFQVSVSDRLRALAAEVAELRSRTTVE
jgi:hypothetical protein